VKVFQILSKLMSPIRIALILSGIMAAGAFYPQHSYNYFILLKWMVFATAIWAVAIETEKKRTFAIAVFCAIALVHNPIMRFHFDRSTWLVIDGLSAAWLIFRAITMNSKNSKK
jgi:hypothetical protein